MGNKGKAVKASACWIWKPTQNLSNKGPNSNCVSVMFKKYTYIDTQGRLSGCSRHMTGNISYLTDYEPYDGGYVSFGQGGCKITGKGTIKINKLEFENVYFVNDLKYNLFSMSQICDNKNSVLFTDSKCIVLERNFKLSDDANVLLMTPRQHNMYTIDLNNVVPQKDLTCLVANASTYEMTDDFSRFTWTFFLKTKDETSGILRNFITEIENLKELRNRVAERRNKTLIEAARTMLADAKLLVTFWAEAVNTACYVQNKVLVNKSQNKTPYELFNGDEDYFIRYSMSSKAFRVFNKRTKRVKENLHVDFLENKPIEKGAGPNWLFDIDSLTNSMNYVPVVVAGTNSNNFLGTKEAVGQDVKKDVSSLSYIVLLNWFHEAHLESSTSNAQDTCSADAPESSGNSNPTATSINPLADHIDTLAVETLITTVSSPVLTACLNDSLEPSSDKRLISKRVTSQDDTPSLDNILTSTNRFEDILRVTSNTDDTNGVEADLGNMETTITATPTPTLRIHKDHPKKFPARVYKVEKAMYGLHQVPRAWHQVTPKECHLHAVKRIFRYLKGHPKLGLWYPKESPFDLVAYSDSDYGGAYQDRKSTTRGCQFLGRRLISWQCKKQTIMATSTTEAYYVAAASCCGQGFRISCLIMGKTL
nr:putative reverse transcriptase, RNA-dependent DNA polymerase [Tanacetum cinerariifolium]